MKRILICAVTVGAIIVSCSQSQPVKLGTSSIERIVTTMTIDEKAQILTATGMPDSITTTYSIPRLGIPSIAIADESEIVGLDFPKAALLASTWNTQLIEEVGKAIGKMALEHNVDILQVPGANIHRDPTAEYSDGQYSEDPVVAGQIAAAMVNGIQSNGVGASLKQYAISSRMNTPSVDHVSLTPRALREIYLKGYEIAVKTSALWAVTTSGTFINGVPAPESSGLLRTILRDEWGFEGMVMTGRKTGNNTTAQVKAGSDLISNGNQNQYESIIAAFNAGTLRIAEINRNVTHILNVISDTPRFKDIKVSGNSGPEAYTEVARRAATEGIVLLKNNNNTLPLLSGFKRLAVYGTSSNDLIAGLQQNYEVALYPAFATQQVQNADIALILLDSTSGTNPARTVQSISRAYQSAGKKAIVLLNTDRIIETASWKNYPDAILIVPGTGQENSHALGDILSGKANPSGKLTNTFPIDFTDIPYSDDTYSEDIFVGYRYFDTFRKNVSYPFGFGLSYTTFDYTDAAINQQGDNYSVTVTVTNTGKTAGKEVVQLYVSAPINPDFPRPLKELKAFAKTGVIAPGGSETITMQVNRMDLASFDDASGSWRVERGVYRFLLGASSQDIKQMLSAENTEFIERKVNNVLLPREPVTTLTP